MHLLMVPTIRLTAATWLLVVVLLELNGCQSLGWENLADGVSYTGAVSCQPCHADIYASYMRTGMGRSWYRPNPHDIIEDFRPDISVYDSFSDFHYRPLWIGDSLYVDEFRLKGRDTTYFRRERIDYIVGSGHQTRSYVLERNGYLYEAPITWYVARKLWDLSPGYHEGHNSRFDRPLGTECVHCHNAYTEPVSGTLNRYKKVPLGIDCERCHGPGSLHIERMQRGEEVDVGKVPDYSIVNPAKLPIDRQFDVCQQCHLQGVNVIRSQREYRPGLELSDHREVFLVPLPDTNAFGIASHAARLRQSACFIGSKGKLTCTTCHDPHAPIRELPPDHHQRSCKSCHGQSHAVCSRVTPDRSDSSNSCISCHMPKGGTSDIPHVQFTDHYIRKRVTSTASKPVLPAAELAYVQLLCATNPAPEDHILGKAWLAYYEQHDARKVYLERAAASLPDSCYDARSRLLFYQGKIRQALPLAQKAYQQEPSNSIRAFHYAQVLEADGQLELALNLYLKLFEANPSVVEAANRAVALLLKLRAGHLDSLHEAERLLLNVLRIQTHKVEAYANIGYVYLNLRRYADAEMRIQQALALNPDHPQALQNMVLLQQRLGRLDLARKYQTELDRVQSNKRLARSSR